MKMFLALDLVAGGGVVVLNTNEISEFILPLNDIVMKHGEKYRVTDESMSHALRVFGIERKQK